MVIPSEKFSKPDGIELIKLGIILNSELIDFIKKTTFIVS